MPRLIRATGELLQRVNTSPLDGTGVEERPQVPYPSEHWAMFEASILYAPNGSQEIGLFLN